MSEPIAPTSVFLQRAVVRSCSVSLLASSTFAKISSGISAHTRLGTVSIPFKGPACSVSTYAAGPQFNAATP